VLRRPCGLGCLALEPSLSHAILEPETQIAAQIREYSQPRKIFRPAPYNSDN
jgi:hypothetical protein